jgi:hypothetical protein
MSTDAETQSAILQHLEQAERTLDELDPIRDLSTIVPSVPDPQPEDLKPFIAGE